MKLVDDELAASLANFIDDQQGFGLWMSRILYGNLEDLQDVLMTLGDEP